MLETTRCNEIPVLDGWRVDGARVFTVYYCAALAACQLGLVIEFSGLINGWVETSHLILCRASLCL
jgi:hypothetical protein